MIALTEVRLVTTSVKITIKGAVEAVGWSQFGSSFKNRALYLKQTTLTFRKILVHMDHVPLTLLKS